MLLEKEGNVSEEVADVTLERRSFRFHTHENKINTNIETENTQSEASATAAGGRCFVRLCFTECELTAACDSNISCCIQ